MSSSIVLRAAAAAADVHLPPSLYLCAAGTVLRLPSDRTVRLLYIDLYRDKIVAKPNGIIDFNTAVPSKGASDCHGLAFNLDKYY